MQKMEKATRFMTTTLKQKFSHHVGYQRTPTQQSRYNAKLMLIMFIHRNEHFHRKCIGKASLRPKKARLFRSNIKVMLSDFFDFTADMHFEFLP